MPTCQILLACRAYTGLYLYSMSPVNDHITKPCSMSRASSTQVHTKRPVWSHRTLLHKKCAWVRSVAMSSTLKNSKAPAFVAKPASRMLRPAGDQWQLEMDLYTKDNTCAEPRPVPAIRSPLAILNQDPLIRLVRPVVYLGHPASCPATKTTPTKINAAPVCF